MYYEKCLLIVNKACDFGNNIAAGGRAKEFKFFRRQSLIWKREYAYNHMMSTKKFLLDIKLNIFIRRHIVPDKYSPNTQHTSANLLSAHHPLLLGDNNCLPAYFKKVKQTLSILSTSGRLVHCLLDRKSAFCTASTFFFFSIYRKNKTVNIEYIR